MCRVCAVCVPEREGDRGRALGADSFQHFGV